MGDYLRKTRVKWVKNIKRTDILRVDINCVGNEDEWINASK